MTSRQVNLGELRARAETALDQAKLFPIDIETVCELSLEQVLEELRIYQTELEIQNQQLSVAQAELSGALAKYRTLFSHLPLPAMLVDDRGFVIEANFKAQGLLGLRQNTALQHRSVLQLFDMDSRGEVYACLQAAEDTDISHVGPLGLRLANRETVPHSLNFIHIADEQTGQRLRLLVLTDRSMEVALNKSQGLLNTAQKIAHLGSWHFDILLNRLIWSDQTYRMFGIAIDAPVTYEFFLSCVHPDDRSMLEQAWNEALAGKPYNLEHRIVVNGQIRWVHERAKINFGENNQPLFADGTVLDITERKQAEVALAYRQGLFSSLFEQAFFLAGVLNHEGRLIEINQRALEIIAKPAEAVIGRLFVDTPWWCDKDKLRLREALARATAGQADSFEALHNAADGKSVTVMVNVLPVDVGHARYISVVGMEITERKRAEDKLRLAANVFSHSQEGILITDRDAKILDVNQAFVDITGYSREELLGQTPRILRSGRQDKAFYAAMWHDLQAKGSWYGELWNRRKDGRLYAELLTISSVRDINGEPQNFIALFSDITALKDHQAQLERIAHYDALTGLPNRLLLSDRLRQAMTQAQRRGQRLAVAYLDLDGFKAVNDKHGHEVGDKLLVGLAKGMLHSLREGDTLARLGGDEFIAVLVDLADVDACVPILTRLISAVAQPLQIGDIVAQVTASLGVCFYPQAEAVDADQLLRQADQAMYQAKQAGRNRYHIFDAEHDRSVRGRHESVEQIRQALINREFVLYYQPKVNMRHGEIVGVEALIRWQHPQRGLLAPAAFLPFIEEHCLSIDLGEWVIDTALKQIEAWRAQGLCIQVSVNVGALQLQHPEFVSRVRALLAQHPGAQPGDLQLEVLESSALEDFAAVSQVMADCEAMGVFFALDDFGTGYSSLLYLKQLQASLLKIDQNFVRDILEDVDDLAIVEAVQDLAAAFRCQVIAEGVETLAHGVMLLRLGCEWGQGYAIARPMPAEDFQHWLDTWEVPPSWKALEPVSKDRLPVLFAIVEHQAWMAVILDYLAGVHDTPPESDVRQCRFGHWLDHSGKDQLWSEAIAHPVEVLHLEIHRLSAELIALKRDGRVNEALARIGELQGLRDDLLEKLSLLY